MFVPNQDYLRPTASPAGRQPWLAAPFDFVRLQYAHAVNLGFAPRSIVASGRLEKSVDSLERLVLGPLARRR